MSDRILIVDDEPSNRKILGQELTHRGYAVETANDGPEALRKIESFRPDLIVLDDMMPHLSGLDVLKELRKREDDTPVVMITAYGTVERAVQAMKEGAYDFITRPFEPDHMALVVQKALERQRLKRGIQVLSEEVSERYRLITGESAKMKHVVELAKKAAGSNATVMLLGESGTGKEIFARNIHNWSERNDKPFVTINCVGLSKELLESELFGHEQGAFTGAHQRKRGKLEVAQGGTVFFDEIGDISQELQAKLLRFLQEREFERVGGVTPIYVDVRVIVATNCNLEFAIEKGVFREDLYHRINVVPVTLPPLRERREDIPVLSQYFLRHYSTLTRRNFSEITKEAIEKLTPYNWPGNVRELANVIERAVVLGSGPGVTLADLPGRIAESEPIPSPDIMSYREGVNAARKELVRKALLRTQGNRSAAARMLGLEAKYLLKLMKSLRIE
ncbi:MAG: sigma-54-dependent Fis family transcriptional regulator [Deltaproteobacteria bacterium]|nr:sigma-54-dependent Fis family transcriptional regulator [Deltaproteobacteria bacterium]